jgi:hypothetical protein
VTVEEEAIMTTMALTNVLFGRIGKSDGDCNGNGDGNSGSDGDKLVTATQMAIVMAMAMVMMATVMKTLLWRQWQWQR